MRAGAGLAGRKAVERQFLDLAYSGRLSPGALAIRFGLDEKTLK